MNEKILVVDDVPQNVMLLADLLEVKGYQTLRAESGERGRLCGQGDCGERRRRLALSPFW